MKERIAGIDIFKAGAIILMVLDHLVLISFTNSNIALAIFYAYIPFVQFAFLFISGYLLAYNFQAGNAQKYWKRVIVLLVLFLLTTWVSGETLRGSGVILLAFAVMTAISWILLENNWRRLTTVLGLVFFFSNFLLQIPYFANLQIITTLLADYSYPINSFGVYFLLGLLYFWYRDDWQKYLSSFAHKILSWFILILYPLFFYSGIMINQYHKYLHLPLLIVATTLAGLYIFQLAERIKLVAQGQQILARISSVMLPLYVGHYIFIFGFLDKLKLPVILNWFLTFAFIIFIVWLWPKPRRYFFLEPAKNKSS